VEAYEAYAKTLAAPSSSKAFRVPHDRQTIMAKLLELNKTIDADQTIPKEVFWTICNPYSDAMLTAITKLDEGKSDPYLGGSYVYYTHDKDQPLQLEADKLFVINQSTGLVAIPNHTSFYTQKKIPACYGTKVDVESVNTAMKEKDLCKIKFTAKGCAPGWSVDYILEGLCEQVTKCKEEAQKTLDVWKDVLKGEKTELPGLSPMAQMYKLKSGWKELDALEKYYKEKWLADAEKSRQSSVDVYHQLTLTFACVGAVGWAFVVFGIVLGFVGGGDDGSGQEA
jgi:hypothetical protein